MRVAPRAVVISAVCVIILQGDLGGGLQARRPEGEQMSSTRRVIDTESQSGGPGRVRIGTWFLAALAIGIALTWVNPTPSAGVYDTGGGGGGVVGDGYWMLSASGKVYNFGAAGDFGDFADNVGGSIPSPAVDLAAVPDGSGYYILDTAGRVYAFGSAVARGSAVGRLDVGETAAAISVTPTGIGYWVFSDRGRVIPFGDARHLGDLVGLDLAGPIVSSVATASGNGYYMLGSDGGVFGFGDAEFRGSIPQVLPGVTLDCEVVGLVPTPTNRGYWLVGCDGGVFAFGDAGFVGSIPAVLPGVTLDQPINGMVAYGNGYLMTAWDGGVFNFATDKDFLGSLGGTKLDSPIVGVVPLPS